MTATMAPRPGIIGGAFRHEALLYAGEQGFLDSVVPFLRAGLAAGEATLVVVSAAKIDLLRSALDGQADDVRFAEMERVGRNPACIIPAWREFTDACAEAGRRMRGIGEPVGPDRGPAELDECYRHEALLNLAFADVPGFWLLCPYDTAALDSAVVADARCTHPYVWHGDATEASEDYRDVGASTDLLRGPLPSPPGRCATLFFGPGQLGQLRRRVQRSAAYAGLEKAATDDLVLAVNEVATNSLRYGGGYGAMRVWPEDGGLVCEIRDGGRVSQPLVGREAPPADTDGGRGLWLANQVCDLVQLRSCPSGTVVRLHKRA